MKFFFTIASFAFLLVTSCTKQEFDTLIFNQEQELEKYAETFPDSLVSAIDGVWKIIIEEGNPEIVAEKGDSLVFEYAAYVFMSGPGLLFDTNIFEKGTDALLGYNANYYVPRRELVGRGKLIAGLDRGLLGATKGENCYVSFSARHGFGDVQTGLVPKSSALIYEVWIKDIKKN